MLCLCCPKRNVLKKAYQENKPPKCPITIYVHNLFDAYSDTTSSWLCHLIPSSCISGSHFLRCKIGVSLFTLYCKLLWDLSMRTRHDKRSCCKKWLTFQPTNFSFSPYCLFPLLFGGNKSWIDRAVHSAWIELSFYKEDTGFCFWCGVLLFAVSLWALKQ